MDVNISLLLRKGKAGTENEHHSLSAGLAPMDALGIFHLFDKLIRFCL